MPKRKQHPLRNGKGKRGKFFPFHFPISTFKEREARETQAALEIIIDQEYVKPSRLVSLYQEASEIVAIRRIE